MQSKISQRLGFYLGTQKKGIGSNSQNFYMHLKDKLNLDNTRNMHFI